MQEFNKTLLKFILKITKNGQENSYDSILGIDRELNRIERSEIDLSKYTNVVYDEVDFQSVDFKWIL